MLELGGAIVFASGTTCQFSRTQGSVMEQVANKIKALVRRGVLKSEFLFAIKWLKAVRKVDSRP
jgi:hypothetical protein